MDPQAIDAEISGPDGPVGEVTLRPNPDGLLDTWGSIHCWAGPAIASSLEYADNKRAARRAIVDAVRKAVRR